MHHSLGKIFVSHTAADKPFVRRLADRIAKEGFQVWLDERDLLVGDPLAEQISQALSTARAVVVIVSSASVASKWLRYELNLATDRMIKGQCRVIPIVIDSTPLPAEVRGLLYADCRGSLDDGWPAILTALQYESRRASFERGFWAQAEILLREVFGATGFVSMSGEYRSHDYDVVYLPLQDEDGNDLTAFYEVVSNYLKDPKPLTAAWWSEYIDATADIPDNLSLVVTERPVAFALDSKYPGTTRVGVRRLRYEDLDLTYRQVVVADLTGLSDETEQKAVLSLARQWLIECATILAQEEQRRREGREKAGLG